MSDQLRAYQDDLFARLRACYAAGRKRVLAQAATGAGKTHISSAVCRMAVEKGKRVLFLAHRRRLIQQKAERLTLFGVDYGVLMAELPEAPWARYRSSAPVQVASKDTLVSRCLRNEWAGLPPADLVIIDEARHSLSPEYQALLAHYADQWWLGLDATPTTSDGAGLGPLWHALECAVPTSRLVADGYLVPVRCYAPEDQSEPKATRRGLAGDPVTHWLKYAAGRPTVLFAGTVAASMAARDAFVAAGIPAEHIDARTDDDERERIADAVASGAIKVVCNCGIWTEGVDVPALSCCVLLRTAGSYVLFAQAVGRVMRPHPGKVDAVLIDHAGAVLTHGFPDEDAEWTLDGRDTVDRRVRQAKKDGKRREPIVCPRCALIFSGLSACPGCGHKLARRPRSQRRQDELLVEVAREQDPARLREEKERYWYRCLAVMAHKDRTAGAAAHMYRQRWGEWPDNGFRNVPWGSQWKQKVADLYPQYLRARAQS